MNTLSVVLICKNQAWNMPRLIESVLEHTSGVSTNEIVLVDSASTDDTIDVAFDYPIRIIRLHDDQHLTAAAGRYIGYQHTTGDYVLFLDGDMELCEGWIEQALPVLNEQSELAVLTGHVIDLPITDQPVVVPSSQNNNTPCKITELQHGGGAAIYRRSVLEQVGTFNPFVYSDEEPELCLRIRHAGYRVARIERPITLHYTDPRHKLGSLFARRQRNLYLGFGQNIRYHLSTGLVWAYIKERRFALLPVAGIIVGLLSALWAVFTRDVKWFAFWVILVFLTVILDAIRKRSLYQTIHSIVNRLLIIEGSIRGFTHTVLRPEQYPAKYDIIK